MMNAVQPLWRKTPKSISRPKLPYHKFLGAETSATTIDSSARHGNGPDGLGATIKPLWLDHPRYYCKARSFDDGDLQGRGHDGIWDVCMSPMGGFSNAGLWIFGSCTTVIYHTEAF